jgi:hypothetical protein
MENICRTIVEIVNMNNFSSNNTNKYSFMFLKKCVQMTNPTKSNQINKFDRLNAGPPDQEAGHLLKIHQNSNLTG